MKNNNRRSFFGKVGVFIFSFFFVKIKYLFSKEGFYSEGEIISETSEKVFFANGFKVSEVSQTEAIVWARLCSKEKPNPISHGRIKKEGRANNYYPTDFNEEQDVNHMDGAIIGTEGALRVKIQEDGHQLISEWYNAEEHNDHTVQIPISNLKPGNKYKLKLEAKSIGKDDVFSVEGSFKTADNEDNIVPISLTTSTCQYFWNFDDKDRGFKTYDSMRKLNPDFFIHTGDYVYYDRIGPLATTIEKARHKWHAMDSWDSIKDFYQDVPVYLLKDDHDLLKDDVAPDSLPLGNFSLEDGLKVWRENVALKNKPYRTFRWGKDLQVWLVEGREFRSIIKAENDSERTIWGEEQKLWFQRTIDSSDATFKILFSPTPVVGPDRENKNDNHANKTFAIEGNWLRDYLSGKKGMYVVNGDRHWQYFSIDEKTGLKEFGAGPVSDAQAGGWAEDDLRPEHQFLRVKGGFLGIKVYRKLDVPTISFTHYDVEGNVVNEEVFV